MEHKELIESWYKKYYIDYHKLEDNLEFLETKSLYENTKFSYYNKEYKVKNIKDILKSPKKGQYICTICGVDTKQFIKCYICNLVVCDGCKDKFNCYNCQNYTCKYCLKEHYDIVFINLCKLCENNKLEED